MCGLLALVGNTDKNTFVDALHLQSHRGPDDWGVESLGKIMLGHRRLSIIDLSSHAKQPMINFSKEIIGVYNGEIYNYKELRNELVQLGYQFNTHSDTEVLLNLFHYCGKNCIEKLIGMFAFVIYDLRDETVFACRDRLGIKPLYYKYTQKGMCFSSEVKSIQHIDKEKGSLNLLSISSYLSYRYPLLENSFYENINSLEPGYYIQIKDGKTTKVQYWDCHEFIHEQQNDRGEEYYLNRLKELFASSVAYRTIADVPVGAYLSGGVDSSAVVAQMAIQTTKPINTFTIGFKEKGFNEFNYASEVAEQYKTEHHEILLSPEHYLDNMMKLIRLKDAPLGVPNEVPLFLMSKELRKKVTVVLSGEGADEIFGGYGRIFRSADDYEKLKKPQFLNQNNFFKKYGNKMFLSELEHFLYLYSYTSVADKKKIFSDRINEMNLDSKLLEPFNKVFSKVEDAGYATKMMYAFEKLHLPGLLQRVDTTTMAASVEARVPFVDHRLVEFAFTIPEKYKLKWSVDPKPLQALTGDEISEKYDTPKYILKKAFEDKLSNNILYRNKMGFPVPLSKFFGGENSSLLKDRLLSGELVKQDIVSRNKIRDFLHTNPSTNSKTAMTSWMLLNLEMFISNC